MLSLKQNKYQYTYLNTYIALYFVRQNYLKTHTNQRKLISDPRRGCYIVSSMFIFFLFFFLFFFRHFCPGHISGTVTRRDSKLSVLLGPCGLSLHCCLPSNSLRYFFFFFPATILPQYCPGHISGTVTYRDSKLSVLLGSAV